MPASTGWRRSRPRKARNDPDSDGIRQGGSGRSPSNVRGYSYFDGCSISQLLRRLVELRASQINGCSYCIFLHSRQIKELGETGERNRHEYQSCHHRCLPRRRDAGCRTKPRRSGTPNFNHAIPNIPGKSLVALVVDYAPGGASRSHTHAKSAFIYAYIVSGAIESQVNDGPKRVYRAGECWGSIA